MQPHNSKWSFGAVSRFIHHSYLILFFSAIALILYEQTIPAGDVSFVNLHSGIGVLSLLLLTIRLIWIKKSGKPNALGTPMQKFSANFSYALLVGTMIAMPLSGLALTMAKARDIDVFGIFTIPGFAERNSSLIELSSFVHEYLSYFTYALLLGHIGATLFHHFIIKDATITRMFGSAK